MSRAFRNLLRVALPPLLAVALAGCMYEVKNAPQRAVLTVAPDAPTEPLGFAKLTVDIRRGTKIGGYVYNLIDCLPKGTDLTWGSGRFDGSSTEIADLFHREMAAAGYAVVDDPSKIFKESDETRATYRVGGRLRELQVALCDAIHPLLGYSQGVKGEAYVKVEWQVFDTLDRKVVLSTTTEGTFKNEEPTLDGETITFHGALANAVANLAADPEFHRLATTNRTRLGGGRTADAAGAADRYQGPAIKVPFIPPHKAPLTQHMDGARSAVVTILTDGGHGSGFFISKKGLILTNHHVVGGAKIVKIRTLAGREMIGEVLRSHKTRDVALVMVEEQGYPALPIRAEKAAVGEEVYAIGTPLFEKLSTTVSKGIVSAIRRDKDTGREDIQADVDIHSGNSGGPLLDLNGNVVGITYAGYLNDSKSAGLNLFVPIADALEKLNIQVGE